MSLSFDLELLRVIAIARREFALPHQSDDLNQIIDLLCRAGQISFCLRHGSPFPLSESDEQALAFAEQQYELAFFGVSDIREAVNG